jgi:hypothetical protein
MSAPISSVSPTVIVPSTASAHTLQAFIELVYVKTANDVLTEQMASLEAALATTQGSLDTLTQIQNLHNLITVKAKGQFPTGAYSAHATVKQYTSAASAFFGTPVSVSVSFSAISGGLTGFQTQMQTIRAQLVSEIASLNSTTPTISGRVDSNSLLAKLQLVLKDIDNSHAISTASGAMAWITDNYNKTATVGVTSAGLIQQHITDAITAGQSLNTTQTESVRNFLYLFEEYYKSASAVLQAISQLIQKMADGIAR